MSMQIRDEKITGLIDVASAEQIYKIVAYRGKVWQKSLFVQVCLKHIKAGSNESMGWAVLGKQAIDDLVATLQKEEA